MRITGTHVSKTFEIDDVTLEDAVLERCRLIYSGGPLPVFKSNLSFINCTFAFEKGAGRAMDLLSVLLANGAKEVVESAFESVRLNAERLRRSQLPKEGPDGG